jgi:hypothetical protein
VNRICDAVECIESSPKMRDKCCVDVENRSQKNRVVIMVYKLYCCFVKY